MEENNNSHRILVEKPEARILLGRTKGRWENNIKIYSKEIEWEAVDWIHLALLTI
jgi:hypothetical protein